MFVGSYNCVPVAVMEIKDCKTGAPVSRSADSPDASIVEQRRLVLTSVSQRRWGGGWAARTVLFTGGGIDDF